MEGSGNPRALMTSRRMYTLGFFALGWMAALGVAFHFGVTSGIAGLYRRVASRIEYISQRASDVEGSALTSIRRGSRAEYLEPMRPVLSSLEALRNPRRMLFG